MAGIGFVRDAQNTAKRNRDNLKNKRNFQQTYVTNEAPQQLKFKDATPEELEEFRINYIKKKKAERLRKAVLLVVIIAATGLFFTYLFS